MQFGSRPYIDLPDPTPESTLRWMRQLALDAQRDLSVRGLAEDIVSRLEGHDYLSEYAAVLNWVRLNIRYSRDPRTIEQVKTPKAVVETRTGDCDDMAVLIASLVGVLGGRTRYVAGAFKQHAGRPVLAHVWCEAFSPQNKAWVVLDPVPGKRVNSMLGGLMHTITAPAVD